MKRNKAKNILRQNEEINKRIEANVEKTSEVGNKLLRNEKFNTDDFRELGTLIALEQNLSKNQVLVCELSEFNEIIDLHKDDNLLENPIYVICFGIAVKSVFCIIDIPNSSDGDQFAIIRYCLYKDFMNTEICESIKDKLQQCFNSNIIFKVHAKNDEIKNEQEMDLLLLNTFKKMIINLKYIKPNEGESHEFDKKKEFIEYFDNPRKSWLSTFKSLKNFLSKVKEELFSLVQGGYYQTFASDVDQLSHEIEFKKAIKEFIDKIPLLDDADNFKYYQKLLEEFVLLDQENIENNVDILLKLKKLNEARDIALGKTKEYNFEESQLKDGNYQLDIINKFPEQMKKFTRIFEPLTLAEVDENLDKTLQNICNKLDLEYEKLKKFFVKKKVEVNEEQIPTVTGTKNIVEVLKNLPKIDMKTEIDEVNTNNKMFETLISEIEIHGTQNSNAIDLLKSDYHIIKSKYLDWKIKTGEEVYQWAASKKGNLSDTDIYEALAVMDRANELVTGGHRLRDTQILSVLTFVQQRDKGMLSQIQTGEGKTTIVSIVAAIKVLQGEIVDIITSNPVLAKDGIDDKINFYNLLNISASTNNLTENYTQGERICYKSDIVYGSISSFQFDYLKDSFLGLKTRSGREFGTIILDEVDSMIIDNASHIAKLSEPLPGMENLKYIYIKIWQEIKKAEENIASEYRDKLRVKAEELHDLGLPDDIAQDRYDEYNTDLMDSILERIKEYVKASNPTNIDIIPSHVQDYAARSLDRWINSALDAKFNYNEDEQYIIRNKDGEKVIQPVDYANTGITLKNTIWQYGLHQFLQLKHNLHLTSESLTSCFISNLGYIKKYGNKIYGLTGTLGSQSEQKLLSSIYNVSYSKIPTYREKNFVELEGEIIDDENFYGIVAQDVLLQTYDGRAVLIICETIKDAKTIHDVIQTKDAEAKIRLFFDEDNAYITKEYVDVGDIVIATNIAGNITIQTNFNI